jgi:hypothetical protein
MISGLLAAVASNRIVWPDEPSTQVWSLGKSVLRLLSGRCPCFDLCWLALHHSVRRQARLFAWPRPARRSRPFVRVALLLAGSWTWHCISVLALRRIHFSLEESAGDDTVLAVTCTRQPPHPAASHAARGGGLLPYMCIVDQLKIWGLDLID